MALIEQQQQEPNNKSKSKPAFFVIKRKGKQNTWMPIALYDEENYYRGIACFNTFWEAVQYQKKYEDKLIQNHLKESKRHSNHNNRHLSRYELKLFVEHSQPSVYQLR